MGGGSSIHRTFGSKSNAEFVSSLRSNLDEQSSSEHTNGESNGNGNGTTTPSKLHYKTWTKLSSDGKELQVPSLELASSGLEEEREQYDITLKLFYLPGGSNDSASRTTQTREAINLVLKELGVSSADLLIVSFPGIYFDEQEDCPSKISTRGPVESEPEGIDNILESWKAVEALKDEGLVNKLGVAEFGAERLAMFLEGTTRRPTVNQINLRDCCSVPRDLLALAKSKGVELLVHNDCSNILPRGTLRELLGPGPDGAGVLAPSTKLGDKRKSLHGEGQTNGVTDQASLQGEVQPQWVVKYTAVVKNRGIVENKGYFACAELEN
jgi:glutamate--cysteine ligase regulatory subunit